MVTYPPPPTMAKLAETATGARVKEGICYSLMDNYFVIAPINGWCIILLAIIFLLNVNITGLFRFNRCKTAISPIIDFCRSKYQVQKMEKLVLRYPGPCFSKVIHYSVSVTDFKSRIMRDQHSSHMNCLLDFNVQSGLCQS